MSREAPSQLPRQIDSQRRHTLLFLEQVRDFSPVFLDTEVDATEIVRQRERARDEGRRLSVVTLVVHAAGKVLTRHREANSAIGGVEGRSSIEPDIIEFDSVNVKVALDKKLDGRRVVLATVIPDVANLEPEAIQEHLDDAVRSDPDTDPRFDGIRTLRALPGSQAKAAFDAAAADLTRRASVVGTVAVTSLGHSSVDSFYSVGGTTITLGVGRVVDRPVVRDSTVVAAPIFRLSLTFDHRVIDGAEAADVLTEIKAELESVSDINHKEVS